MPGSLNGGEGISGLSAYSGIVDGNYIQLTCETAIMLERGCIFKAGQKDIYLSEDTRPATKGLHNAKQQVQMF